MRLPSHWVQMLPENAATAIRQSVEARLTQFTRELRDAFERAAEKNARMGRYGGIAMYFPEAEAALPEIDRRTDFVWQQTETLLQSGRIEASAPIQSDVRDEVERYRELLLTDIRAELADFGRRFGAESKADLDARWEEGVARAISEAAPCYQVVHGRQAGQAIGSRGVGSRAPYRPDGSTVTLRLKARPHDQTLIRKPKRAS